jgi:hypothetical protein
MSIIPVCVRLRQEDQEFEANLGYIEVQASLDYIVRPCLKKTSTQKINFVYCSYFTRIF